MLCRDRAGPTLAARRRFTACEPDAPAFTLLWHRAALFAVILLICCWAAFRPEVRQLAVVAVTISMAGIPDHLRSVGHAARTCGPSRSPTWSACQRFGSSSPGTPSARLVPRRRDLDRPRRRPPRSPASAPHFAVDRHLLPRPRLQLELAARDIRVRRRSRRRSLNSGREPAPAEPEQAFAGHRLDDDLAAFERLRSRSARSRRGSGRWRSAPRSPTALSILPVLVRRRSAGTAWNLTPTSPPTADSRPPEHTLQAMRHAVGDQRATGRARRH